MQGVSAMVYTTTSFSLIWQDGQPSMPPLGQPFSYAICTIVNSAFGICSTIRRFSALSLRCSPLAGYRGILIWPDRWDAGPWSTTKRGNGGREPWTASRAMTAFNKLPSQECLNCRGERQHLPRSANHSGIGNTSMLRNTRPRNSNATPPAYFPFCCGRD
jgi:hypothetical protein